MFEGIFKVVGLKYLEVRGNGATVKLASGQRYGSFNTDGTNSSVRRTEDQYKAAVGPVFEFLKATGTMSISDINVDGNMDGLVKGNEWGDTGIQAGGSGIVMDACPGSRISKVTTKYLPLDGITIRDKYEKRKLGAVATIDQALCEYSGRQGLSFIAGNGLTVTNSRFAKTGRGKISSAPKAGLDIEPNVSEYEWTRNGLFKNCTFEDNAGAGLAAPFNRLNATFSIDGGHAKFEDCTFVGTTYYAAVIQQPSISFTNCKFFGTAYGASDGLGIDGIRNKARATTFTNCEFSDTYKGVNVGRLTVEVSGTANAKWIGCQFNNTSAQNLWMKSNTTYGEQLMLSGCTVVHGNSALKAGSYQSNLIDINLTKTRFTETKNVSTGPNKYTVMLSKSSKNDNISGVLTDYLGKPSTMLKWYRA